MARISKTYTKLQDQFEELRKKNPNDEMLKYQVYITNDKVSIYENSKEYDNFMNAFGINYGTEHQFVLKKCLNAITARINTIQKQGGLEKEVQAPSLPHAL